MSVYIQILEYLESCTHIYIYIQAFEFIVAVLTLWIKFLSNKCMILKIRRKK